MKKIITFAFLLVSITMAAQKPILSPMPQQISWGRQITKDLSGITIRKGIAGDEAIAEFESKIPEVSEGYYLRINSTEAVLAGRDERGLYYAEKTLQQLLGKDRTNDGHTTKRYAVEVQDWPSVPDRGVVEGFYGNPWTHEARLRMFDFLADNKMNMYIYGPKDDPYHWNKWATLYPAKELAQLKELVQYAAEKKVKFVWAVHTGQSLTDEQYDQLYDKLEQLYNIGVRVFGMFFDDAAGVGATQATILNKMNERFIKTHEGCEPFICCPAVYCGTFYGMGDKEYLPDMTRMTRDADVKIMWTGSAVMDMQLGNSVQNFINSYSVKPFIWHNWPVNDYSRDHLFMGKTDGLDSKLYEKICGFTANPMEFPEASKVTCYSVADYLWNMAAYEPDRSWQQAWQYMYPQHAAEFGLFCQNSVNPGSNRINRPGESTYFTQALASGTPAHQLYTDIYDAATALLEDDSDPAVAEEMRPWLKAMQITGRRGMLVKTMQDALAEERPEDFIEAYQLAKDLADEAAGLQTHTWYGGSGYICPTYAALVINPRITKEIQAAEADFKRAGFDYPDGLFKAQVIEDGVYYIKYNGKLLTNSGDNPNLTGDRPSFSSVVDDIKPAKQQWRIEIDGQTGRYKITSVADGRYLNEIGKFWANKNNNPYDATWNTYHIYRRNGKHAIQNGGNGGNNFWTVNGDNIEKGSNTSITSGSFMFDIVPIDGEIEYPVIENNKKVYIAYGNMLLTDMSNLSFPYFSDTYTKSSQLFKFVLESGKNGRMKLVTAKTGSNHDHVNEIGNFGNNNYSANWNTYELTECGGLWAIRNAENGGSAYWTVTTDGNGYTRLTTGGSEPEYLFEIGTDYDAFVNRVIASGIESPTDKTNGNSTVYSISGQRVSHPGKGVYIANGKKIINN